MVDWCLYNGGASMESLYLTLQSNLYFQQPLVNRTSHKQTATINDYSILSKLLQRTTWPLVL